MYLHKFVLYFYFEDKNYLQTQILINWQQWLFRNVEKHGNKRELGRIVEYYGIFSFII